METGDAVAVFWNAFFGYDKPEHSLKFLLLDHGLLHNINWLSILAATVTHITTTVV